MKDSDPDNLFPFIDEEPPLVDDVMSHEAEAGYWISAMQRAGIEPAKIKKAFECLSKANKMPPYKATQIYRKFQEKF